MSTFTSRTRPPAAPEDNRHCDPATFARIEAADGFALSWAAHGLHYGIPACMDAALVDGRTVVCNVSRTVVESGRRRYADVLVVEVTAPASVLAERLARRDRPQDGDLHDRAARSDEIGEIGADVTIVNATTLDEAARAFAAALAGSGTEQAGHRSNPGPKAR